MWIVPLFRCDRLNGPARLLHSLVGKERSLLMRQRLGFFREEERADD